MKVLVVGGAGYIGSHCVKHLLRHGHEAVIMDNFSTGHRQVACGARSVEGDLRSRADCRSALAADDFDVVMHFAAFCYVGESVKDPAKYYENNVVGTYYLLDAMREAGIERFVFSSSCATFGVPDRVPIDEDLPQRPVNPYGRTKLMVERMLEDFRHAYGLGYAALRYFNAAGADPDGELGEDHRPETHLIPNVILKALGRKEELVIFGDDYPTPDGACIRDDIHVNDLAEAHRLAMEKLAPGRSIVLNLGNGSGYSNLEVVRCVEEVAGGRIDYRIGPRREGDPPRLVADSTRAHEQLGWHPRFPELKSIVSTAFEWFRTHPEGYAD